MLSRNLEKTLHRALAHANERRHEYATLEHLLLALTEDQDAVAVLRACTVDLEKLRRDLTGYVDNERKRKGEDGTGTAVITKTKTQTKRPSLYRVLLLNDDYTPMEFVVHVLERFFNKDREAATRIMLHVHHHGIGECGVFTYEVAETKVTQVMDFARKHQHPLQCVMEKK